MYSVILILHVLCIHHSDGNELLVSVAESVKTYSDNKVTLPCIFEIVPQLDAMPIYTVTWINQTVISERMNIYVYRPNMDTAVNVNDVHRYSREGHNLIIENVGPLDNGNYCCEITVNDPRIPGHTVQSCTNLNVSPYSFKRGVALHP